MRRTAHLPVSTVESSHPDVFDRLEEPLRRAYSDVDWSSTPLGALEDWPAALDHALDLCLSTLYPSTLLWGPEHVLLYNQAYVALIGDKHPEALGRTAESVFGEAWDQIGPLLRRVLHEDEPVHLDDALIPLRRRGFLEDCYFSFSYSPLHDEHGQAVGVLDIAAETTERVLAVRRLQQVAELRGALAEEHTREELADVVAAVFADNRDLLAIALRLPGAPVADALPAERPAEPLPPGRLVVEDGPEGPIAWFRIRPTAPPGQSASGPDESTPVLVARLNPGYALDSAYLDFVSLVGTTAARAWDRLGLLNLERQAAADEHEVSLTLQRHVLSPPVTVPGVEISVRYQPATLHTQIGGDWYDAFLSDTGDLVISVGDVSGHDLTAVSVMAQVRTLMRGLAFRSADEPSTVLGLLDDILLGLNLGTMASGILCRLSAAASDGSRELTWSNAGHPPMAYRSPGRPSSLLQRTSDMLLGLGRIGAQQPARATHAATLEADSVLILFTDGLIERHGRHLDEGFGWVCQVVDAAPDSSAEEIATRLVADLPPMLGDDVAVMVLKVAALAGRG